MRKSGKELRKEYLNLLDNIKALESRIKDRAEVLMTQYPDVLIGEITTAGEFINRNHLDDIRTIACVRFIEKIEDHIAKQHPHQQKKLFEE